MTRRLDPRVSESDVYLAGFPSGVRMTRQLFDAVARHIFDEYKANWPVDTGLSKRGLGYTVAGTQATGYVMILFNRFNYAVFVERRWYPFSQQRSKLIRDAVDLVRADFRSASQLRRSPVGDQGLVDLFLQTFLEGLGDAG